MRKLTSLLLLSAFIVVGVYVNSIGDKGHAPNASVYVTPRLPAPAFQVQDVTMANIQAYVMSQPRVVVEPTQRWNTKRSDPTATWPDATDPTRRLPMAVQVKFACIRYHESRNHLHSVEIHSGAGGWYQFIPYIWDYARANIPGLPALASQATGDEQSKVAMWYYKRNNGFTPEWSADAGVCNL